MNLHLDCCKCLSENVQKIGEPFRDGNGLFVKIQCNNCNEVSDCGDGDYFMEIQPKMIRLSTYPQPGYDIPERPNDIGETYIDFEVSKDWLKKTLEKLEYGTLIQFLQDYTWDDSERIFHQYMQDKE